MLKTCDVIRLINDYGDKATLSDILKIVADGRIYECPKCNGLGYTVVEYNAYPEGLPDSCGVYEPGFKNVECDICQGEGYTREKYEPKYKLEGYFPVSKEDNPV